MNVANVLMNVANVPNVLKVSIFNLPNMLINLPNLPNILIPTSLVWLYSAQYRPVLCPISQCNLNMLKTSSSVMFVLPSHV